MLALAITIFLLSANGELGSRAGDPLMTYEATEVQAAFVYKFLYFAEWPEEKSQLGDPITVGVVGDKHFRTSFRKIAAQNINGRAIEVRFYDKDTPAAALTHCHLLYIAPDLPEKITGQILKHLRGLPVLTVSARKGFMAAGGLINFVSQQDATLGFEVNQASAEKAGIHFRSRFLRLAVRVKRSS